MLCIFARYLMTTENPDFLLYIGSLRETVPSELPAIVFAKLSLPGKRLAKMLCIFARYLIDRIRGQFLRNFR